MNSRVKIADICTKICSGGTPKSGVAEYYENGKISWLNTGEINFNRIRHTNSRITKAGLASSSAKWISKNSISIAMYGATAGKAAVVKIPLTTNQACCNLEINESAADYRFVYYWLQYNYSKLANLANGGAQQNLSAKTIKALEIDLPPMPVQRSVAEVLSRLDDKIELNNRLNDYLGELAMATYVEELEYSEDELPDGWSFQPLSDFFPVKTGKKDANISTEKGKYPFFTCSQKPIAADCYSFDGTAILVAGNGDFNVKWYRGKFEAYQRTYVLMPNEQRLLGYLYCAVKRNLDNITAGARGSVIKFITKSSIADCMIAVPPHPAENRVTLRLNTILKCIDARVAEIKVLEELRDTLLPKLMSGEIDVSKVDLTQLNNHLAAC